MRLTIAAALVIAVACFTFASWWWWEGGAPQPTHTQLPDWSECPYLKTSAAGFVPSDRLRKPPQVFAARVLRSKVFPILNQRHETVFIAPVLIDPKGAGLTRSSAPGDNADFYVSRPNIREELNLDGQCVLIAGREQYWACGGACDAYSFVVEHIHVLD